MKTAKGTVVITGAGRGIGRAVAARLARAGYPLVLISKTACHLQDTRAACERHVPVESVLLDIRDESQFARLADVLRTVRCLHAVINNAGIGEWTAITETSAASWDAQLETNLRGPFFVTRETLPYFQRQGRGLYVNVASDCALIGMSRRAAYNASKFGLVGLTASLRAELDGTGVHASLVYAGKTDTHFRNHTPGDRPGALSAARVAGVIAFIVRQYPRVVIGEMSVFPRSGGLSGPRSFI